MNSYENDIITCHLSKLKIKNKNKYEFHLFGWEDVKCSLYEFIIVSLWYRIRSTFFIIIHE